MPAPTVVLVRGAFTDSASFTPVTRLLLDGGLSVIVSAVPNRSLTGDAAYLASLGQPVEIAHAVAFLASDAAGFLTGIELFVDGGANEV